MVDIFWVRGSGGVTSGCAAGVWMETSGMDESDKVCWVGRTSIIVELLLRLGVVVSYSSFGKVETSGINDDNGDCNQWK